MSTFKFNCNIALRWSDHDELGHVNNAHFLTYLEEARIAYLEHEIQFNWKETGLILARVEIDYKQPLYYEQGLIIGIKCTRLGNSSFDLAYKLNTTAGDLVAEAKTIQVTYDYAAKKPIFITEKIRSAIAQYEGL
jgi:acyl-CoA thioester hydrolase